MKTFKFTLEEIKLIDTACQQMLETLDNSKERWVENDALRNRNEHDMKVLAIILEKLGRSFIGI